MIEAGVQIFASSPADEISVEAAKAFIVDNELTYEDVKMGRVGNCIVVEAKRVIKLLS